MVLPIAMRASSQQPTHDASPSTYFQPGDILSKQDESYLDSILHTVAGDKINIPRFRSSSYSIPFKAGMNTAEPNTPRSHFDQKEREIRKSTLTADEGQNGADEPRRSSNKSHLQWEIESHLSFAPPKSGLLAGPQPEGRKQLVARVNANLSQRAN